MRVGIGFDTHRMAPGRRCIIGGIEIPHATGPLGHSDGDVLLHALVDAILGAAALGDIGAVFPDTDPAYKDAESRIFVEEALRRIRSEGYELVSVDSVVVADSPRIAPYREKICQNLASMLSLDPGCVSVKGKTLEGLSEESRDRMIAAHAVAVLRKKS